MFFLSIYQYLNLGRGSTNSYSRLDTLFTKPKESKQSLLGPYGRISSPITRFSVPWFSRRGTEGRATKRMANSMMQWCGAAARRMLMTERSALMAAPSSCRAGALPILCGRGDKKTKKGKRFKGSYGNARPKREKKIERIKDKVEVPRSTPWPLPFKLI